MFVCINVFCVRMEELCHVFARVQIFAFKQDICACINSLYIYLYACACVCVHGMCHAFASKCLIKVFSESSTDCTSLQEFIDLILLDAASLCVCVFFSLCVHQMLQTKAGLKTKYSDRWK